MTYTERPRRGRAKQAWDFFRAKFPSRNITLLYYSPNCYGTRSWICELEITDADMRHCSTYDDFWVKWVSVSHLDYLERNERVTP